MGKSNCCRYKGPFVRSVEAYRARMGELNKETAGICNERFASLLTENFQVVLPGLDDFNLSWKYLARFDTGLRAGDALDLAIASNMAVEKIITLDEGMLKAIKKALLAILAALREKIHLPSLLDWQCKRSSLRRTMEFIVAAFSKCPIFPAFWGQTDRREIRPRSCTAPFGLSQQHWGAKAAVFVGSAFKACRWIRSEKSGLLAFFFSCNVIQKFSDLQFNSVFPSWQGFGFFA